LQKTYGQCKKCTELAGLQPTTENFHELRKAVKALWNQMILLRPVWPAYYGFMVHHLDVLAQKLGFEHDLAELEKMLSAERSIKNKHQHSLLEFIAGKRLQIQLSILPAARRLFTDKAAAVGTRMEVCYGMFLG
jgi:CHAD domain-containing protein